MSNTKIAGIALIVILVGSVVALVVVGGSPRPFAAPADRVAVVYLHGPIQDGPVGPFSPGVITPEIVRRRAAQIEADPRIRAAVLRVNSPGGTVAASQEVAGLVEAIDVPVVVSMGDTAASGGYYIASSADHIVAQPGTLTGSIGVIWATIDVEELLETIGVELDAVTAGDHKDMFLPGRLTAERRELVQAIVDLMYDDFVTAVADGRGMEQSDVRDLATGQVYTGRQALDIGLIDELGGVDAAVAAAERLAGITDARIVEFRPSLFEQLSGGPGVVLRRILDGGPIELILIRDVIDGYQAPRY